MPHWSHPRGLEMESSWYQQGETTQCDTKYKDQDTAPALHCTARLYTQVQQAAPPRKSPNPPIETGKNPYKTESKPRATFIKSWKRAFDEKTQRHQSNSASAAAAAREH